MAVVTFFGSSQSKEGGADYEMGRLFGKKFAQADYTICNGGYGGIMEATARGAKEGGGQTIGVTTEDFGGPVNRWIDKEIKLKRWSERLFKLIELGDGYVVFDGGTGTLVELFVVWEMSNKKFLEKPIVVLGRQLRDLVEGIRKWPQVIDNPNVFLTDSPEAALGHLREWIGS